MGTREEEFLRSLQATFKVEAAEHLQTISDGLLALEKAGSADDRQEYIEAVFRAAHSLKGAARAVNFRDIESQCQSMEDVLAGWRSGATVPSEAMLDSVHRKLDRVHSLLGNEPAPMPERKPAPAFESVRVPIRKLDSQIIDAEEMLAVKLLAGQRAAEIGELAGLLDQWPREWTKVANEARAVTSPKLPAAQRQASRMADFLDWNADYFKLINEKVDALKRAAEQDRNLVGKLVDDLLEDSKKLLMLPAASLGAILPKIVRDLCREQGKRAEFVMTGEEIEVDNRILNEMKDPLIHLVRNSVDHGIEPSEERLRLGKPASATIRLAVTAIEGNKVQLELSDDGRGINLEKVRAAAIKLGQVTEEQARELSREQTSSLVFKAEVSTSPIVTQLSGRGLGLAIVREKTQQLGGRIAIETQRSQGTTFKITLPMALATLRGILVEAGQRVYAMPTSQVEKVGRFNPDEIRTVENRATLSLDGKAVALVHLTDALGLPRTPTSPSPVSSQFFILGSGAQRIAFAVDLILDEQEILVKPLRKPLSRVRNISGATMLGSGRLAPVLNAADLLKSATAVSPRETAAPETTAITRSLLVVEDSITSRMLLKGILESAGYRVKTATNGAEGFAMLREDSFDLVISDVEMPRLNGFELTTKIRADKHLADLPVILVTALETPEDRERGIDVGANAYLVKSNFDQSNLLEAVRRFV